MGTCVTPAQKPRYQVMGGVPYPTKSTINAPNPEARLEKTEVHTQSIIQKETIPPTKIDAGRPA